MDLGDVQMSTDAKKDSKPADVPRVSRRVECLGPGKNVLMPDIYNDEDAANDTSVETPGESTPEIEVSEGFNPYDTGSLYKK
jgi:hypothetical protein